jgi:hypothetical protein
MAKVTHVNDSGAEVATIELDDFVKILYSGIAEKLRKRPPRCAPLGNLSSL